MTTVIASIIVSYLLSLIADRGKPSPVDLNFQGFGIGFGYRPGSASLAIWAAPQIAVNRAKQKNGRDQPKQADDGKGDQANRSKVDKICKRHRGITGEIAGIMW
jgi:hypothetical protein